MLVVLVVFVSGTWHPTWGWAMSDRYDPQYHFMPPRDASENITAMQACEKQRYLMSKRFPKLKFSCETHL